MSYKYYNNNYELFLKSIETADISNQLKLFLNYLPKQAKILDAGCGTGRDSIVMKERGYDITAFDASYKMAEIASNALNNKVIVDTYETVEFDNDSFDGIWASASLLHVNRNDMLSVYDKLYSFLKPGGYLYASYKCRDNDFEKGERHFTCYTEDSFKEFVKKTKFELIVLEINEDSRVDRDNEMWINAIMKKA